MILDKFSLEGKTAIVTGGGTGLGRGMALALARAGADVAVAARRAPLIEETAAQVAAQGRRALAIPTDVTVSDQVNRMVERVLSEWGQVDILVNNAGIVRGERPKPLWEISDAEWHRGIDTNLTGAFFCCRAVSKHMMERRRGKIINIASLAGLKASRDQYMYASAKAGVILLTGALAISWAREGINVNAIAPGLFDTVPEGATPEDRQRFDAWAPFVPVGRFAQPQELGHLAVLLASEASDYITGTVFIIDGAGLAAGFAPTGYAPVIPLTVSN